MSYPVGYTLNDALREHLGRFQTFKDLWCHLNLEYHPELVRKITREAHNAGITGQMTLAQCIEAIGGSIIV